MAGAVRADPEYLNGVGDFDEAVFTANGRGPSFDRGPAHLDCLPAGAADEMVVVLAAAARPIDLLAVCGEHIRLAAFSHRGKRPVHGGQADSVPGRAEPCVEVLGADEGACR